MPVIACPGCGKQYKIAATAAGQVAKCACGKKFRLGGASTSTEAGAPAPKSAAVKTASASAAIATPTAKRATVAAAAPVAPAPKAPAPKAAPADDGFWDDALPSANKPAPAAESTSSGASAQSAMIKSGGPVKNLAGDKADPTPKKKKKKKSGGVKWGFDWGKVIGGLCTFLIFGGITAAMAMASGRISIYLSILALGGLFTALNGLMGEEGIW